MLIDQLLDERKREKKRGKVGERGRGRERREGGGQEEGGRKARGAGGGGRERGRERYQVRGLRQKKSE